MGLDHYNIAPDDKGGRPEKEEEDYGRTPKADNPLTTENDTEEFWQDMYGGVVEGEEPTTTEIEIICGNTALLPRAVKRKLENHNIHEFEEVDTPIDEDMDFETSSAKGQSSNEDSGFAAIINEAKE